MTPEERAKDIAQNIFTSSGMSLKIMAEYLEIQITLAIAQEREDFIGGALLACSDRFIEQEREACAGIADIYDEIYPGGKTIAKAIRDRK